MAAAEASNEYVDPVWGGEGVPTPRTRLTDDMLWDDMLWDDDLDDELQIPALRSTHDEVTEAFAVEEDGGKEGGMIWHARLRQSADDIKVCNTLSVLPALASSFVPPS